MRQPVRIPADVDREDRVIGPLTARQRLHELIRDVLAEAAIAGEIRDDIAPDELAIYCRHALDAAGSVPTKAEVRRLVTLTLTGLGAMVPLAGARGHGGRRQ